LRSGTTTLLDLFEHFIAVFLHTRLLHDLSQKVQVLHKVTSVHYYADFIHNLCI